MAEPQVARALSWRRPTDHPCDHEGSLFVADGIGGKYSICDQGPHGIILWWADDEFTFAEGLKSVEEAKRLAEEDWQRRVAAVLEADRG